MTTTSDNPFYDRLKFEWRLLCMVPEKPAEIKVQDEIFDELVKLYAEPHRHYHTIEHIFHVRDAHQRTFGMTLSEIDLAIYYHDAIYDTKAKDNEERSAQLMAEQAKILGFDDQTIGNASALILATKTHALSREDFPNEYLYQDALGMLDADLGILGAWEAAYFVYEMAIREEYAWVPQKDYVEGRIKVLQSFLDREWIYHTKYFRQQYEGQARKNLKKAIQLVKDQ